MKENKKMKQHLIDLLLEEYKQHCLFSELEKKGVGILNLCVNNLDIVLDIIGFPKDNSNEYDYTHLNTKGKKRDKTKKIIDNEYFCRDWLSDKYYETFYNLTAQQKICVTENGLEIESGADIESVQRQFLEYVDWLYVELKNWENGEYKQ